MNKKYYTSVVRVKGSEKHKMVPVKSNEPIDQNLFIECSKVISRIYLGVPIESGDEVCSNILNTGVDIITTRSIKI